MLDTVKLHAGLKKLGIDPTSELCEGLDSYCALLADHNTRVNLTAITAPDDMLTKHILDSLTPLAHGLIPQGARVIDVGSGAGLPALPLALARPDITVTALDATRKKVDFIAHAAHTLRLTSITALCGRAETLARDRGRAMRAAFDVAVSRAVAALPVLCELCLPLVRVGGALIAYKGESGEQELAAAVHAAHALGGAARPVIQATAPGSALRHTLIVFDKTAHTPNEYPRDYAAIKKRPL